MEQFVGNGGKIYAGGTCLKSRNSGGSEMCSLSTMKEMHDIVRENGRVVTFCRVIPRIARHNSGFSLT